MKDNHNGSFSQGFVWGLIFGVIFTVLLGTKRGRTLIKELSDRGLEAISDFLENQEMKFEEESTGMDKQDGMEDVDSEEKVSDADFERPTEEVVAEPIISPAPRPSIKKRVFKGIKKK